MSRRRFAPVALLLAALLSSSTGPRAWSQEVQSVFRTQMAMAKADVYQGRIRCQLDRLMRWGSTVSGGTESLRFENGDEGTSMHYQLRSQTRHVTIDAWRDTIKMERVNYRDGRIDATTRFEQPVDGRLTLFVQRGDTQRTLEADTIWHLWLADSRLCAENLLPLCEMLGMDTPWLQFTGALETQLVRQAEAGQSHDATQWRQWIDDLSDPRYSVRESADRQLRAAGNAISPFVRRLDPTLLDAEQRFRLRRILHSMEGEIAPDTVDSAAEWLLDDPSAWVELLDREDAAMRTCALQQLQRILSEDVEWDPNADEEVRREQIARLRDRVGGVIDRH